MLFTVSRHFNLDAMKASLKKAWGDMKTDQKTAFVKGALEKQVDLNFLEEIDQMCKEATEGLGSEDPHADEFIQAYQEVHLRIFTMKTRPRAFVAKT